MLAPALPLGLADGMSVKDGTPENDTAPVGERLTDASLEELNEADAHADADADLLCDAAPVAAPLALSLGKLDALLVTLAEGARDSVAVEHSDESVEADALAASDVGNADPLTLPQLLGDSVATAVGDNVGSAEEDVEADSIEDTESVAQELADCDALMGTDALATNESELAIEGDGDAEPERELEAGIDSELVSLKSGDTVPVALSTGLCESLNVGVAPNDTDNAPVGVKDCSEEDEGDSARDARGDELTHPDADNDRIVVGVPRVDGSADALTDTLAVELKLGEADFAEDNDGISVERSVAWDVPDGDLLLLKVIDTLAESDAHDDDDREAAGDTLAREDADSAALSDPDALLCSDKEAPADNDGEGVSAALLEALPERDGLAVELKEALAHREGADEGVVAKDAEPAALRVSRFEAGTVGATLRDTPELCDPTNESDEENEADGD